MEFNSTQLIAHLKRAIVNSSVEMEPFPHFYVNELLPTEFFVEFVSLIPSRQKFDLADPELLLEENKSFYFSDSEFAKLSPHHKYISKLMEICVTKTECLIFEKLEPYVYLTLKMLFPTDWQERVLNVKASIQPDHDIIDRGPKFAIYPPHLDYSHSLGSWLYYLPQNDKHPHLGTDIHEVRLSESGEIDLFEVYFSRKLSGLEFRLFKTSKYLPNTAFAFLNSPISFHGARAFDTTDHRQYLSNAIVYEEESFQRIFGHVPFDYHEMDPARKGKSISRIYSGKNKFKPRRIVSRKHLPRHLSLQSNAF
jgi:hypothetical protein